VTTMTSWPRAMKVAETPTCAILPVADRAGYSNAEWIAEGDDLADEGGGNTAPSSGDG
jgi:hypothetical protein